MREFVKLTLAAALGAAIVAAMQPAVSQLANNVAPTVAVSDNSNAIATTAWVRSAVMAAAMNPIAPALMPNPTQLNAQVCTGVPTGGRQVVQRWVTWTDQFGNPYYIPAC